MSVAALLLFVASTVVVVLQVRVHADGVGAACGAPFDVFSGRADWQTWYADDLTDPRLTKDTRLVRTDQCPSALNRRTVLAGVLGAAALAGGSLAWIIERRSRPRGRPTPLHTLGVWVTAIGVALTAAGLTALVLLLANGSAALYLYVDRWVVATVGAIVLVPALALAAGGRALMRRAGCPDDESTARDRA